MKTESQNRKLPKSSLVKPVIQFYSVKNKAAMFCESELEVDALRLLEFAPSVARYVTQPKSFSWRYQGRELRYTPDILVQYINGIYEFVEVKPLVKAKNKVFTDKFVALRKQFSFGQNSALRLMTCPTIRHQGDHIRRRQLYRYRKLPDLTNRQVIIALNTFNTQEKVSIGHLVEVFQKDHHQPIDAWNFLANWFHRIDFLGEEKLTNNTQVRWNH